MANFQNREEQQAVKLVKVPPLNRPILKMQPLKVQFLVIPDPQEKWEALIDADLNYLSVRQMDLKNPATSLQEVENRFNRRFYQQRIPEIESEAQQETLARYEAYNEILSSSIIRLPDFLEDQLIDVTGMNPNQTFELEEYFREKCRQWIEQTKKQLEEDAKQLVQKDQESIEELRNIAITQCEDEISKIQQ
ncbi:MAG TPA: hypothetical protein DCQ51_06900 [Planktothrix sp. UBA8407]|jgi:hypothetical protein|nr:hypothetical protein [Planktothrix sp. UBA8407]HBK22008.1 hypothetical protein [Planktothrix sp. UBA10369]